MRLYHATNVWSAEQMKEHGMGLDEHDYFRLAQGIAKDCGLQVSVFRDILDSIKKDSEANGGVSFMPTLAQANKLLHYGTFGGEWRGSTVDRMLKKAARLTGTKLAVLRTAFSAKYTGTESKSCIVVVDLPKGLIHNKDMIGQNVELYTTKKVDSKYIVAIITP